MNTQSPSYIFRWQHPFSLEQGTVLPELQIAYTTLGTLNTNADNVVWVCHALTGNADAASWWSGLIGQGCFFDPKQYFIVCANVIGSCYGSTGPLTVNPLTGSHYYADFPEVTIRDMVRAHELLRKHLNIKKIHTCIGGSLGGQQALEWAIMNPSLIEHLVIMASNAQHSPWGIAFNEAQRMAIYADPTWCEPRPDAGLNGLKAARAMALLSYRNYEAYQLRQQETSHDKLTGFKAASYVQYQGEKLTKRFNAIAYVRLSQAMDSHNIARGRGEVPEVLASICAQTLVIGISSDILFPTIEQKLIAQHIPGATYQEIDSVFGHDGFLVEYEQIAAALKLFYQSNALRVAA
ncbi:MAG: homoserine O-acetyltransferase [Cytophagales bacterium]|nr:homoserine O-acetyltransferase [Bernardetiaceae bacterium]MDW8203920.1 homoserine O-acetyltransferase [Cytophagales bacterium]